MSDERSEIDQRIGGWPMRVRRTFFDSVYAQRVRDRHQRVVERTAGGTTWAVCGYCIGPVMWPCAIIQALDVIEEPLP